MKVQFIPKRREGQEYMDAPDSDWIALTDFCNRVVYFQPHEAEELIAQIRQAAAMEKSNG